MKTFYGFLALLLALLGCDRRLDTFDLEPDSGMIAGEDSGGGAVMGDAGGGMTDSGGPHFEVLPADIIFVVDNSGSMREEQENLALNFDRFIDQIAGAGDYRVAVISTDLDSSQGNERAGFIQSTFSAQYPNHLREIDGDDCRLLDITHGCFRGPDPPTRVIASSSMTRAEQIAAFQENVRVGTCGTGNEQGLGALMLALQQTAPAGCNDGFLRSNANLIVIFVSDEDDTGAMPVADLVATLEQIKPYSSIRVAAIVGSVDGNASDCAPSIGGACGSLCQNPPPSGSLTACMIGGPAQCGEGEYCERTTGFEGQCQNEALRHWTEDLCRTCSFYNTPDCCSASPGARYIDFARAIEVEVNATTPLFPIANCRGQGTRIACLVDSICQESFGDTLARIARELVLVEL